jgi:hypothetical protein
MKKHMQKPDWPRDQKQNCRRQTVVAAENKKGAMRVNCFFFTKKNATMLPHPTGCFPLADLSAFNKKETRCEAGLLHLTEF